MSGFAVVSAQSPLEEETEKALSDFLTQLYPVAARDAGSNDIIRDSLIEIFLASDHYSLEQQKAISERVTQWMEEKHRASVLDETHSDLEVLTDHTSLFTQTSAPHSTVDTFRIINSAAIKAEEIRETLCTYELREAFGGEPQKTLLPKPVQGIPLQYAFNSDGSRLIAYDWRNAGKQNTKIWDAFSGEELFGLDRTDVEQNAASLSKSNVAKPSVLLSSDGNLVVTRSCDGKATVYDTWSGTELFNFKCSLDHIKLLDRNSQGNHILIATKDENNVSKVRVLHAISLKEFIEYPTNITISGLNSLLISPDGMSLICRSKSDGISVYDSKSGCLRYNFPKGSSSAFSPNGDQIVIGNKDGTIDIIDSESGDRRVRIKWGQGPKGYKCREIYSVKFSTNGSFFVTEGWVVESCAVNDINVPNRGTATKVWDSKSYKQLFFIDGGSTICSDSGRIASNSNTVGMYDVRSGKKTFILEPCDGWERGWERRKVFSPDGRQVVTSITDPQWMGKFEWENPPTYIWELSISLSNSNANNVADKFCPPQISNLQKATKVLTEAAIVLTLLQPEKRLTLLPDWADQIKRQVIAPSKEEAREIKDLVDRWAESFKAYHYEHQLPTFGSSTTPPDQLLRAA